MVCPFELASTTFNFEEGFYMLPRRLSKSVRIGFVFAAETTQTRTFR